MYSWEMDLRRNIVVVLLPLFFVGCAARPSLVGRWKSDQMTSPDWHTLEEFKPDGTYSSHFESTRPPQTILGTGTYRLEGNELVTDQLTFKRTRHGDTDSNSDFHEMRIKMRWISKDRIEFLPDGGRPFTWTRSP